MAEKGGTPAASSQVSPNRPARHAGLTNSEKATATHVLVSPTFRSLCKHTARMICLLIHSSLCPFNEHLLQPGSWLERLHNWADVREGTSRWNLGCFDDHSSLDLRTTMTKKQFTAAANELTIAQECHTVKYQVCTEFYKSIPCYILQRPVLLWNSPKVWYQIPAITSGNVLFQQ